MLRRGGKETEVAIIEFETKDEALAALTRDQKQFEDSVINVSIGAETTLWLSNLPLTADEEYFRNLFSKVSPSFLFSCSEFVLILNSMVRFSRSECLPSNMTPIDVSVTCSSPPLVQLFMRRS
jgi:RNA recognition motif-containing protein